MSSSRPDVTIEITPVDDEQFLVVVAGSRTTRHQVTVTANHLGCYAPAGAEAKMLLDESFRFLLEREANTSILPRFALSEIERYFPEYRAEIRRRLEATDGGA